MVQNLLDTLVELTENGEATVKGMKVNSLLLLLDNWDVQYKYDATWRNDEAICTVILTKKPKENLIEKFIDDFYYTKYDDWEVNPYEEEGGNPYEFV